MKKYDFTDEIKKEQKESKSFFSFKSSNKKAVKNAEKGKKSLSYKQKATVNSNFQKIFQFQKSKMLQYPIDTIREDGLIHTTVRGKSEYSYILGVQGHNLANLSEEEYDRLLEQYWALHKSYLHPFKEIYAPFPENTSENIAYFTSRNKNARQRSKIFNSTEYEIDIKNKLRDEEIRKLKIIQDNFQSRQSFIAIYGDTLESLEENFREIQDYGVKILGLEKLARQEVELLFSILNGTDWKNKKENAPSQINFSYAQHLIVNNKPEAIITITSLAQNVTRAWLLDFTDNRKVDAATVDIQVGKSNYNKDMSDAMEVLDASARKAKKGANVDRFVNQYKLIRSKLSDLENNGEVIKYVTIRMIVRAETLNELKGKTKKLVRNIESNGHKARIFTNMGFFDWSSRFISYDIQNAISIGRTGVERSSEALALGFAHNQMSINDKNGSFFGRTITGGSVLFNHQIKTGDRLSYDFFISGGKGSGKSTCLKKIVTDDFSHDNFIYIYDKAREFKNLVKYLGGTYLSLDGSDGKINMFQVFPLLTSKATDDEEVTESTVNPWEVFNSHINKIVEHFKNWTVLTADGKSDVLYILNNFYQNYFSQKGYAWYEFDITGLSNEEYPTFDDFYKFLTDFDVSDSYRETKEKLQKMAYSVTTTKREKFVGTTTIDQLLTKQIVAFDISNVSEGASDDFDILFSMSFDLVLSITQNRGRIEKDAYENKQKTFDDVTRTLIVIDECHNILNPNKLKNTEVIGNAMRENRKYFYGFAFATQMVENMLPTNAKQVGDDKGQAIQNMSSIVGLCQYKAWLRQSPTSIPTLKKYFDVYFRDSDYKDMQNYKLIKDLGSQMILTGAGRRSTEMYFYASPFEVDLFKGGA